MHLDPRTYEALLGGTLPPEQARALADHLSGDCEACARFLAEVEADDLDGRADAAVARAFPPRPLPPGDLEFARIARRLDEPASHRRRFVLPAAIAAGLLVAGLAGLLAPRLRPAPSPAGWDGVKGTASRAVQVRLRLARLSPSGETAQVGAGGPLEGTGSLLFEVDVDRPAEVALVRALPGGGHELLWRDRVPSGRTVVTVGGKPASLPLATIAGPQRFAALASEGPIDDAAIARAPSGAGATGGDRLSVDVVQVDVR